MRILFLSINPFLPDHDSDLNRTLLELTPALNTCGHEAMVLAGRHYPSQDTNTVLSDHSYGFRLFRANNPIRCMPELIATLRPDITVIVGGDAELLVTNCQQLRTPIAVWFFSAECHYFRNGGLNDNLLYMASSQYLSSRIKTLFGIQATVLPAYIEQKKYQGDKRGNHILFVNPVREKGVELVLAIARKRPDLIFIFLETWGISEQWRQYCFDSASQAGNIEWVPKTIDRQSLLSRSRLLLIPSITEEGCSRIITEAQIRGIPALGSDRGHIPAAIGPGGAIVELDAGIDTWLQQFDQLFQDDNVYERASSEAVRHAERDELRPDRIVEHLLDLLTRCINDYRVWRRINV